MKLITYSIALLVAVMGASASAQPAADAKDGSNGTAADTGGSDGSTANGDKSAAQDAADGTDVDALRQEYLKLRDQLFRARARVATVASALYSTKLRVHLDYTSARFYSVTRATIRLDGSSVFDDTQAAVAKDKAPRFDGFIAPGRHQIEIRIEAVGKDDERFKSVITNSFTVQAPAGKDLIVRVKAKDGGDIPYKWKKNQSGTYRLHLDVNVKANKTRATRTKKSSIKNSTNRKRATTQTNTGNSKRRALATRTTHTPSHRKATRSHGKRTKTTANTGR